MSNFELISLMLSSLAIIVSFISFIRTNNLAKEQLELEKITSELSKLQIDNIKEEQLIKSRPQLNLNLTKIGKNYNFYITNTGKGSAYELEFELLDCDSSPIPMHELESIFPYQELKESSRIKILASIGANSPKKYKVKLSWREEDNEKYQDIFWPTL